MSNSKVAVISDVHANYQALQAVLAHAWKQGVSDIWFLGDAVGYGPEPHRCLQLLEKEVNCKAWVLGNHDEVMRCSPNNKPTIAGNANNNHHHLRIQADPITQYIGVGTDQLTAFKINYDILDAYPDSRDFLLSHPTAAKIHKHFFLVHGGIRSGTPTTTYTRDRIDIYNEFLFPVYKITKQVLKKLNSKGLPGDMIKQLAALKNQEISGEDVFLDILRKTIGDKYAEGHKKTIQDNAFFTTRKRFTEPHLNVFFHGHTHYPACFSGVNTSNKMEILSHDLEPGEQIPLDDKQVWFLNPGSVGQPRNGDCRASYLVLDPKERIMQLHCIAYNIRAVQKQMERLAMPINLISRLSKGR
jgi:predicted phosphodiesterase